GLPTAPDNLSSRLPSSLPTYYFSFNDTPTTELYTLSLHDALPIYSRQRFLRPHRVGARARRQLSASPGRARRGRARLAGTPAAGALTSRRAASSLTPCR